MNLYGDALLGSGHSSVPDTPDIPKEDDAWIGKLCESVSRRRLLKLYRHMHNGMDVRINGIDGEIRKLTKEWEKANPN